MENIILLSILAVITGFILQVVFSKVNKTKGKKDKIFAIFIGIILIMFFMAKCQVDYEKTEQYKQNNQYNEKPQEYESTLKKEDKQEKETNELNKKIQEQDKQIKELNEKINEMENKNKNIKIEMK